MKLSRQSNFDTQEDDYWCRIGTLSIKRAMENQKEHIAFEQVIECGCGIDIHKSILVATIRGLGLSEETRTFDGFTQSIESLRDWLKKMGSPM